MEITILIGFGFLAILTQENGSCSNKVGICTELKERLSFLITLLTSLDIKKE
jgi:hypothetical protein